MNKHIQQKKVYNGNAANIVRKKIIQVLCKRLQPQKATLQFCQSGCKACIKQTDPINDKPNTVKDIKKTSSLKKQRQQIKINNSKQIVDDLSQHQYNIYEKVYQQQAKTKQDQGNLMTVKQYKLHISSAIVNFCFKIQQTQKIRRQSKIQRLNFQLVIELKIQKHQKKLELNSIIFSQKLQNMKSEMLLTNKQFKMRECQTQNNNFQKQQKNIQTESQLRQNTMSNTIQSMQDRFKSIYSEELQDQSQIQVSEKQFQNKFWQRQKQQQIYYLLLAQATTLQSFLN